MLTLDGPHLAQVVSAFGGFLKLPSAAYAVFCNNHMVHHRGQLSTYLAPDGRQVPGDLRQQLRREIPGLTRVRAARCCRSAW